MYPLAPQIAKRRWTPPKGYGNERAVATVLTSGQVSIDAGIYKSRDELSS